MESIDKFKSGMQPRESDAPWTPANCKPIMGMASNCFMVMVIIMVIIMVMVRVKVAARVGARLKLSTAIGLRDNVRLLARVEVKIIAEIRIRSELGRDHEC